MFLAQSEYENRLRREGVASSKNRTRPVTPTNGLSKGLTLAVLGLIAAATLIMAFAPSASIYQG